MFIEKEERKRENAEMLLPRQKVFNHKNYQQSK
jgi:hypothetical protein